MSKHVSWAEIQNFHNIRRTLLRYPELLQGNSTVKYKAKVKLHGSNAGVRIDPDGTVAVFSRTSVITPESDNFGFAKWVQERKHLFSFSKDHTTIYYGEWAGPGVQDKVALSELKNKIFAIFAVRFVSETSSIDAEHDFCDDPEIISRLVKQENGCYVLPWFNDGEEYTIEWAAPADVLEPVVNKINSEVDSIEKTDPWVFKTFGISGTGEGLVFYPVSSVHRGYKCFENLAFKAKGEKHKIVEKTKPAQVDATVAASASAFAEMVVTQARCEQGVLAVNSNVLDFDSKNIGQFLSWIHKDIIKETKAEIEASGIDIKILLKACSDRARMWYISNMKKL